jgi:hypothetical protein
MSHVLWGWVVSNLSQTAPYCWVKTLKLVIMGSGLNFFRAGQFTNQLLRLVNEGGQALGANPRGLARIPQRNQGDFAFGPAAIEAVLHRTVAVHN